ncbi:MAG: (2Fe-2S)-binding protein [Pirellulales bacterium]|nr:(2Fe-2S)-binding protein [Pirellulales bacterium]
MTQQLKLKVNGRDVAVDAHGERPLLDVLREDLGLTGAKYGCGEGQCGACTVLLDGAAVRSCVTTVADAVGMSIETIEGLGEGDALHPLQQAFVDHGAAQCGYCVPGQIMSAVALLRENARPSRAEIIAAMNGNLCRCCNYPSILAAIEHAASPK